MSAGGARTLQLSVNSSLVSGVAAVLFDILLLSVVKALSQSLCASDNLRRVYDNRRFVAPSTSRLGCLTAAPVGSKTLSRLFSLLIVASTVCVIIVGFAINGTTVRRYQPLTYRSVVRISNTPVAIDYEQDLEILPQTDAAGQQSLVAKRVVATSDIFACQSNNNSHISLFAYAFKETFLDDAKVNINERFDDGECITPDRFDDQRAVRQYPMALTLPNVACSFDSVTPARIDGKKTSVADFATTKCDIDISRLQCYSKKATPVDVTTCAGVGLGKAKGAEDILFVTLIPNIAEPYTIQTTAVDVKPDPADYERYAANVAFIAAAGFGGGIPFYAYHAVSNVDYNVTLQHRIEDADVSEIDLRLAIPTLGFLGATTLILFIASIILGICVVYNKGRIGYNRFCSVPEILQLSGPKHVSKLRRGGRQRRYIGVRESSPTVGVLRPDEQCGDTWAEADLEGRY